MFHVHIVYSINVLETIEGIVCQVFHNITIDVSKSRAPPEMRGNKIATRRIEVNTTQLFS